MGTRRRASTTARRCPLQEALQLGTEVRARTGAEGRCATRLFAPKRVFLVRLVPCQTSRAEAARSGLRLDGVVAPRCRACYFSMAFWATTVQDGPTGMSVI